MKVFVDDKPVEIISGMTVRHALIAAGLDLNFLQSLQVRDEWGNLLGHDGALCEGARLRTTDIGIENRSGR